MDATRGSWVGGSGPGEAGYRGAFDRLFERGRDAVLSGAHYRDTPPVEGGRWGLSVVLLPDMSSMERISTVTAEAMRLAGPGHWPTGVVEAVHFTVRAIQVHRRMVPADDPLELRCAAGLRRAAAAARSIRLRLSGLTLTPSGVMLCAFPEDGAADDFADRLGKELGADGWFEAEYQRDIWYATLVHFTDQIRDPSGLVDWVAAQRDLALDVTAVSEAELVRFAYNGRQPVRAGLARATFGGVPVVRPASVRR
jgi:hypothetical protein